MRIITGHDYYDTALAFGHDDHVVFVREKDKYVKEEDLPGFKLWYPRISIIEKESGSKHGDSFFGPFKGEVFRCDGFRYDVRLVNVVVCGKWYAGFRLVRSANSSHYEEAIKDVVWTKDALDAWFAGFGIEVLAEAPRNYVTDECSLDAYFERRELSKREMDWTLENGVTIMVHEENSYDPDGPRWRINGDGLKDIRFYRVLDAYQMFQEVEMWVGGVLSNSGRPIVEITDDKVKIAKHGFDELSFRKPKQGKS